MADRTVKVSLTAQVSGYLDGMEKARKATAGMGSEAEQAARKVQAQGQAMQAAGKGLMAVGAVALAATALSVKAAIGWESAWTGVTKTVEGTPAELAKVEDGLRSLAKTLPTSHEQIAAVAEAAGQLGIKTASVTAFTKTMIDLGETTNLSADEAATSLARFMNVMGTSQDDVGRLGSAIVELGNNYATTEAEIVAMSMRLSGAGRQVGLSEGEVLGLATALSSVGIEAEAGGSAISKVMIDIASSVDSGGERVEQFAKVAGVSAQDFTKQWKTDPGAALAGFVKGLGDAEAQGGSTLGILEELGITEVRMRDALLRSAAASDQFTAAMDTGNQAMIDNNALSDEAAKRYQTIESQLEITKNKVIDASISFGQVFLPAVSGASDAVGDLADGLGGMDPIMQGTLGVIGVLTGAAALSGGTFLLAVPKIAAYRAGVEALGPTAQKASRIVGTAMKGLGLVAGVAIAITALNALDGAIQGAGVSTEDLANKIKNGKIQDALTAAFDGAGPVTDFSVDIENLGETLDQVAGRADTRWAGIFAPLLDYDAAVGAAGGTATMLDALDKLGETLAAMPMEDAQAAMRSLRDEYNLTDEQMLVLINKSGPFRDALVKQASDTGQLADDQTLLKIALEKTQPAVESAADAYLKTADEASALGDELMTLMESMNELNGVGQDASSANIQYQQSLLDVSDRIAQISAGTEGYAKTLDISTQAGIDNRTALDEQAASLQDAAKKQFDLDGNVANYKSTLERGHQTIVDNAIALGASADEANRIADEISKIPEESEWKLIADTETAATQLSLFKAKWDGVKITGSLFMDASNGDRSMAAAAARYAGQANAYINAPGHAGGGTITGPGTGTSDSVLMWGSAGEEVTREAMARKYRPLLKAINADRVPGYATGGTVGYATTPQYVPQQQGGFASQSAAPITVMVASKGGVDLLQYVDVTVQQAGVAAANARDSKIRRN